MGDFLWYNYGMLTLVTDFEVGKVSFNEPPDWLRQFVALPTSKYTTSSLEKALEVKAEDNSPWLMYLWDALAGVNQKPDTMLAFAADFFGLPPIDISVYQPDVSLFNYLPRSFCSAYYVVPFALTGPVLSVACLEPSVIPLLLEERKRIFLEKRKIVSQSDAFVPFYPTELQFAIPTPTAFRSYMSLGSL